MNKPRAGNRERPSSQTRWQRKLHEVIFEADTPAGKGFDVILIVSILASVLAVMFDSISEVRSVYGGLFYGIEWFFTLLFTLEYVLRLACVGRPLHYATSFYGIVDLLAIVPTYLSLVIPGSQFLLVIRILPYSAYLSNLKAGRIP